MAEAAIITALPTVIAAIGKIIPEIEKILQKDKIREDDQKKLKEKNDTLKDALKQLVSIQEIGLSLGNYEEIYDIVIQEETTAKDFKLLLETTLPLWQTAEMGKTGIKGNESIKIYLQQLKNLDSDLNKVFKSNKDDIEKSDSEKIDDKRNNINEIFKDFDEHKNKNTNESWEEACKDIGKIYTQLSEIDIIIKKRLKKVSGALIKIRT